MNKLDRDEKLAISKFTTIMNGMKFRSLVSNPSMHWGSSSHSSSQLTEVYENKLGTLVNEFSKKSNIDLYSPKKTRIPKSHKINLGNNYLKFFYLVNNNQYQGMGKDETLYIGLTYDNDTQEFQFKAKKATVNIDTMETFAETFEFLKRTTQTKDTVGLNHGVIGRKIPREEFIDRLKIFLEVWGQKSDIKKQDDSRIAICKALTEIFSVNIMPDVVPDVVNKSVASSKTKKVDVLDGDLDEIFNIKTLKETLNSWIKKHGQPLSKEDAKNLEKEKEKLKNDKNKIEELNKEIAILEKDSKSANLAWLEEKTLLISKHNGSEIELDILLDKSVSKKNAVNLYMDLTKKVEELKVFEKTLKDLEKDLNSKEKKIPKKPLTLAQTKQYENLLNLITVAEKGKKDYLEAKSKEDKLDVEKIMKSFQSPFLPNVNLSSDSARALVNMIDNYNHKYNERLKIKEKKSH